jgi:hypothetical protein
MTFKKTDLMERLSVLDKDSKKKTVPELEELKETITEFVKNAAELSRFLDSLTKEKWNPKTLEIFSECLSERLSEEGPQEENDKAILAILRANYRGMWVPGLVKGLLHLLQRGNADALDLLKEIITKPRKSKKSDVWGFYEKNFASILRPHNGFPYLMSLYLQSWPEESSKQIGLILKKLAEKYANERSPLSDKESLAALAAYLVRRCAEISQPWKEMEFPLLKLVANQKVTEWTGNLAKIIVRLKAAQHSREISWAEFMIRQLEKTGIGEEATTSEAPQSLQPGMPAAIASLEDFEERTVHFFSALDAIIREHKNLKSNYQQALQDVADLRRQAENLEEDIQKKNLVVAEKDDSLRTLRLEKSQISKEMLTLQSTVVELRTQLQEEIERSDVRIHQIQLEANMQLRQFKNVLWQRINPDLDDLIHGTLQEDDYASPERGRSLYRRLQDIIRKLRDLEVIPGSDTYRGVKIEKRHRH